ncbi:MAG TPA: aminotransferase class V-fold PLP-dependent enzyme [Actinomycetota bacterium]
MDLAEFRAQFPALADHTWLNTATAPPAARPVAEELRRVQREWETGEFAWTDWEAEAYATRPLFARLIGADPDEVALVSSVSYAAATVAASLSPRRIVVGAREFRSNYFPWVALADRGFEIVEVPANAEGVVTTDALLEGLAEGALVAVSEVQSSNGYRIDLARLTRETQAQGGRVFVDLCQSLGCLRFDAGALGVDYAAVHGYKWMLGPRGAAWLYVRRDHVDECPPLTPSWKSPEDPYAEYYGGPLEYAKTARKLDVSLAWFSWPGARAALELLLALDAEAVEERAVALARAFREGAGERGYAVCTEELPSQIVGMEIPDAEGLQRRLREQRVVAAVRGGFLRIGFHGFNDERDVERGLAALDRA